MSHYTDTSGGAGHWLIGTAKRNPEALLVLAAGCALLLRGGGSSAGRMSATARYPNEYYDHMREQPGAAGSWGEGISRGAETAKEYASDVTGRASDMASSYASAASRYAEEGGRAMSRQASRLTSQAQSTAAHLWREQPLAVALFGLAAGAALAAVLPKIEAEERAMVQAREAMADAAGRAGENLKEAAGEAAERLKQGAAERGLSAEGLKEMARDATETFTSKVAGESRDTSSPSVVPGNAEPVGGGSR
jgi:hypothetical protein